MVTTLEMSLLLRTSKAQVSQRGSHRGPKAGCHSQLLPYGRGFYSCQTVFRLEVCTYYTFHKPSAPSISSRQEGLLVTEGQVRRLSEWEFSALQLWKFFPFFSCSNLNMYLLASPVYFWMEVSAVCQGSFYVREGHLCRKKERERRRMTREGFKEQF